MKKRNLDIFWSQKVNGGQDGGTSPALGNILEFFRKTMHFRHISKKFCLKISKTIHYYF